MGYAGKEVKNHGLLISRYKCYLISFTRKKYITSRSKNMLLSFLDIFKVLFHTWGKKITKKSIDIHELKVLEPIIKILDY